MAAQNFYVRYMQRSIQLFMLFAIGWFLPEVIFYFIHFDDADQFEIKRFITALFLGIFMLHLISTITKKRKKKAITES